VGVIRPFLQVSGSLASAILAHMQMLAISGSLRARSSNTNLLRAFVLVAPPGIEILPCPPLDALPFYNFDIEEAGLPPSVQAWRQSIAASDALLISSPEYAHGVSGVLKNALDWLVGGTEISGKPMAVINAKPAATMAHAALLETLRVMGGQIVDHSAIPLPPGMHEPEEIAADPDLAILLVQVLASLRQAAG